MRASIAFMSTALVVLTGCGGVDQNPTEFKPGFVLPKFEAFALVRMDQLTAIPEIQAELQKQPVGNDLPFGPEEVKTIVVMGKMPAGTDKPIFGVVAVLKDAEAVKKAEESISKEKEFTEGEWNGRKVYTSNTRDGEVKATIIGNLIVLADATTFEQMMTAYLEGQAPGSIAGAITGADPEAEIVLYGDLDAVRSELDKQLETLPPAAKPTVTELAKLTKNAQIAVTMDPEVSLVVKATALNSDAANELAGNLKAVVNTMLKSTWETFKPGIASSPSGKEMATTIDSIFAGTAISTDGDEVTLKISGFGKLNELLDQGKQTLPGMMMGGASRLAPPANLRPIPSN